MQVTDLSREQRTVTNAVLDAQLPPWRTPWCRFRRRRIAGMTVAYPNTLELGERKHPRLTSLPSVKQSEASLAFGSFSVTVMLWRHLQPAGDFCGFQLALFRRQVSNQRTVLLVSELRPYYYTPTSPFSSKSEWITRWNYQEKCIIAFICK